MDRFPGIKVRIISVASQIAFKSNDNSVVWSHTWTWTFLCKTSSRLIFLSNDSSSSSEGASGEQSLWSPLTVNAADAPIGT